MHQTNQGGNHSPLGPWGGAKRELPTWKTPISRGGNYNLRKNKKQSSSGDTHLLDGPRPSEGLDLNRHGMYRSKAADCSFTSSWTFQPPSQWMCQTAWKAKWCKAEKAIRNPHRSWKVLPERIPWCSPIGTNYELMAPKDTKEHDVYYWHPFIFSWTVKSDFILEPLHL